MRRVAGKASFWLGILLLFPLALLNFNPLHGGFLTDFTVTNRTDEPLTVSPMGIAQGTGKSRPLPTYVCEFPALPAVRLGDIAISPGQSRRFRYDWDDIIFTEIVVRVPQGDERQVDVEPDANYQNCCYPPRIKCFAIDSFEGLSPVRAGVSSAARAQEINLRALLLYIPLLAPILIAMGVMLLLPLWRSKSSDLIR